MSVNNCRLCFSSTTKLTSSITDEVVRKFLDLVPQLNVTSDSLNPTAVCQLCYGKAKISSDFIQKILEVQKKFIEQLQHTRRSQSGLKIVNSKSLSTKEALAKVQKVGSISVKKVSAINQHFEPKDEDYSDEIEELHDNDDVYDVDGSSGDEFEASKDDSDIENDEDEEEFIEEDSSDDSYEPASKKKKSSAGASKRASSGSNGKKNKTSTAVKDKDSSQENKEIFIDAPIAFLCAKCRGKFESFDDLTEHMKARVCYTDKFICKECGKEFLSKKALWNHNATHKPKEKYMCEVCAKEYNHQFDLESHMETVHHKIVKRDCIYRCTHCNDKFQSHLELLQHVKEHQREKKEAPRLCEVCAKVCANLKAYQSHIVIHKEKKAHVCNVCGKGFSKTFLYQQHMHIHTGIKAFGCDICDKAYAKRDSLRIHKKRDHPELH